jgi:hypothetical protein
MGYYMATCNCGAERGTSANSVSEAEANMAQVQYSHCKSYDQWVITEDDLSEEVELLSDSEILSGLDEIDF